MLKKIVLAVFFAILFFIAFCYLSVSGTKATVSQCVIPEAEDLSAIDFKSHDSVLVAASHLYQGNPFKNVMQGDHYRQAWSQPIKVPVLWLDDPAIDLDVVDVGGGTQTRSLKVEDPEGTLYTLRSVNKDPSKYVPEFLRQLGLENIVIDGISAQHPYGAIVAAALAEDAGVLHTHPRVVFVPQQDRLDTLNTAYGNRLFLLEYETEGERNWTRIPEVDQIVEIDDLVELKMELRERLQIDKPALVRARLLDFLIGDWDRHNKQWGWALKKDSSVLTAIPIAGDRDNAFYKVSGIIPSIITYKSVTPNLRPFEENIDYLEGLVKKMDTYFLLNTDETVFVGEATHLQQILTDEKIEAALRKWPIELYQLDGEAIKQKIIARRNHLIDYAKQFKQLIDSRSFNTEKLSAIDDMELPDALIACFECQTSDLPYKTAFRP
ncbi:hypothetical protein [Flavilitoribacter nigricans]|uniref:Uncharacterized protein n=1 Tax=Flavilitoribacter nigricans (strain ATCC 23147 / DSM 23189 / NBRC 102662 / NCIMB 1420 / SS-2) TaxID=1122177 RepID=A0A2D0NAW2_FLAN2|nr:hypothetical protein [Flavilitoribacter nigricans]PHN05500.1 hypothetical protein CRP01_16015 [Flavilitoribacter nigricans DSM 23189 = NBRC 102662]